MKWLQSWNAKDAPSIKPNPLKDPKKYNTSQDLIFKSLKVQKLYTNHKEVDESLSCPFFRWQIQQEIHQSIRNTLCKVPKGSHMMLLTWQTEHLGEIYWYGGQNKVIMHKKLDHATLNNSTLSMSIIQCQKECRLNKELFTLAPERLMTKCLDW